MYREVVDWEGELDLGKCYKSPCWGGLSELPLWMFNMFVTRRGLCTSPLLAASLPYWVVPCLALPVVLAWLPLELVVGASA